MRRSGEAGSATVAALSFVGVLLLVATALATVLCAAVAHRRAQSTADLAALSGAVADGSAPAGAGSGCAEAARVAAANRARMTSCSRDGPDLQVEVAVEVAGVPFVQEVRAHARAGPA